MEAESRRELAMLKQEIDDLKYAQELMKEQESEETEVLHILLYF